MTKKELLKTVDVNTVTDDRQKRIIERIKDTLNGYEDKAELGDLTSVAAFTQNGGYTRSVLNGSAAADIAFELDKILTEVQTWVNSAYIKTNKNAGNLPSKAGKIKKVIISVFAGAGSGVLFLIIGLVLAYCVPALKDRNDGVFFTIECVKDILAGFSGGFSVWSIQNKEQNNFGKSVNRASFIAGGIGLAVSLIGAIIVTIFACLSVFEWTVATYIWSQIAFILLALICCVWIGAVVHCGKKKYLAEKSVCEENEWKESFSI